MSFKNLYMRYTIILVTLLLVFSVSGCYLLKSDHFDVFIYPNKNDLTDYIYAGRFDSIEEARDVASEYMQKYPNGDYEIGKNRKDSIGGIGVYEETFK